MKVSKELKASLEDFMSQATQTLPPEMSAVVNNMITNMFEAMTEEQLKGLTSAIEKTINDMHLRKGDSNIFYR